MAYKIDSGECTGCRACQSVCDIDKAIFEWRIPDPDECMQCEVCEGFDCDIFCEGRVIYVIDPERCTECVGNYESPSCVEVCPIDNCCVPDPSRQETKEQLLEKWHKLHPGETPKVTQSCLSGLPPFASGNQGLET